MRLRQRLVATPRLRVDPAVETFARPRVRAASVDPRPVRAVVARPRVAGPADRARVRAGDEVAFVAHAQVDEGPVVAAMRPTAADAAPAGLGVRAEVVAAARGPVRRTLRRAVPAATRAARAGRAAGAARAAPATDAARAARAGRAARAPYAARCIGASVVAADVGARVVVAIHGEASVHAVERD